MLFIRRGAFLCQQGYIGFDEVRGTLTVVVAFTDLLRSKIGFAQTVNVCDEGLCRTATHFAVYFRAVGIEDDKGRIYLNLGTFYEIRLFLFSIVFYAYESVVHEVSHSLLREDGVYHDFTWNAP